MKHIPSVLLVAALAVSLSIGALSVESSDESSINAGSLGNAESNIDASDLLFQMPTGKVSVAEAVTLCARLHALKHGTVIGEATDDAAWYTPYVRYAAANGLASDDLFVNCGRSVRRHELASLLVSVLSEGDLAVINDIRIVPDVPQSAGYADAVLALYRAGIMTGTDTCGSFSPNRSVTRAELAELLERAVLPERRVPFTVDVRSNDDAYILCVDESFGARNSGWQLDNRGAVPRTVDGGNFSGLYDIDATAGSAMIREFNRFDTGIVRLRANVSLKGDGVYLEYRNEADKAVYRLETVDGNLGVYGKDGAFITLCEAPRSMTSIFFEIFVDLDNGRSETRMNGESYGILPLPVESGERNIVSFRYGTTEDGKGSISPQSNLFTVNYAVFEDFSYTADGAMPYGWQSDGAGVSGGLLNVPAGKGANVSYTSQSGNIAAECKFLLPQKESIAFSMQSDGSDTLTFISDAQNFYVNGTTVYENYVGNLWYTLRLEADTAGGSVTVKLNGRKVSELPLSASVTAFDGLSLINRGASAVSFDRIRVFRMVEHDDYVPEPVKPRGEENYTVGINACPIWFNGTHRGWNTISAYDDIRPVLGYYDEGNPETADWEIKYLVEHGVDYQAFCVYFSSGSGPQDMNKGYLYCHPFDGYMNAKYSDRMKYAIIWEAENGSVPSSVEAFKQYYVPYLIEHFFKDDRYMVIDNKPVMHVFGVNAIANAVGGNENVKTMFDYLDEAVRSLGFDGVLCLSCREYGTAAKEMGYDGATVYSWGTSGYTKSANVSSIRGAALTAKVYFIPTVSVGFNEVAWTGNRYPMLSASDMAGTFDYVKNTYFKLYPKENWQKNYVMLSTWNEYGEGTYIMPSGLNGFGYLDAVREAFTSESADVSLNTVPTASQLARITHLYPQTLRALKPEGNVSASSTLTVNGKSVSNVLAPKTNADGSVMLPFAPADALSDSLAVYYRWQKDGGVLTIEGKAHTAVFTVGASTYLYDGSPVSLAYPVTLTDGVPCIPLNILCTIADATYTVSGSNVSIITPQNGYYERLEVERRKDRYEFNSPAFVEGWKSPIMTLAANGEALVCTSRTSTDPYMTSGAVSLNASSYDTLEIRVRYRYASSRKQVMQLYFATNTSASFNEAKTFNINLRSTDSGGEYETYTVDLSSNTAWKDTVTALRFDPFNATGMMEIDYIRFIGEEEPENESAIDAGDLFG